MIDGVVLINKPSGLTSHDVVDRLRKVFKMQSIGHGGTLDPLATGLLICLIGDATKLSQYVMSEEKSYVVGVRFGIQTDSGDITGQTIVEKVDFNVTESDILKVLPTLEGHLELKVPKYSAVKVKGKKLYEYARQNEDIEIPVKTMGIRSVRFLGYEAPKVSLQITCEKGTYIRSWVEEFGRRLNTVATVERLTRVQSGAFTIDQCYDLQKLEALDASDREKCVIRLENVLGGWPALKVQGRDRSLMAHGQIPKSIFSQILRVNFDSGLRILNEDGGLLALITRDTEKGIKLARVFTS